MTPRQRPRKIDWGMANFVFVVASAVILGFMAYAYFNATSSSKVQTLERDIQELKSDVRELQRRRQ